MRVILWVSILVASGVYICGPIMDPDLWWHITAGRWIIANRAIPHLDYWSMFGVGEPWRAYSWSNEILYALLDARFGVHGLLAFKLALSVLIAFSFFYCFGKIAGDWFFGGLLGMFATAAVYNHFTLRPQSLVWVYFIWLLYNAHRITEEGLDRKKALLLVVLMALWANTHLTSVLGLSAVAVWLFGRGNVALAVKGGALCFLGTLLTPYLGGEWITFISKTGHPFAHATITEFRPATIMQYSTAFLLIGAALLSLFAHMRPRTIEPLKLLLCLAFAMGALAVVKFLPFAVIMVCTATAELWGREGENRLALGGLAEGIQKLGAAFSRIPREGLSFLFICMAVVSVVKVWRAPIADDFTPVAAMDFIIEKKLPGPLLNDFGRGGYVMYRLSDEAGNPGQLVSIDGRTNVTPHEIWEKASAAFRGRPNWRDYLNAVKPRTILWPNESPLNSILLETEEWCRIFRVGSDDRGYSVWLEHRAYTDQFKSLQSDNC